MINKGQIINGDFREHDIPKDAFLISDPPYNQKYHYGTYGDDLPTDEYWKLLMDAFKGRKSAIILYPEETINLLGGGVMGGYNRLCRGSITPTLQSNHASSVGGIANLT